MGVPAARRITCDGLIVDHPRYFYTPRILRHWYGQFYRLSVQKSFMRAIDEFQPEIILAPWAYPDGWAAVKLARAAGLPVVVKVHGSDVRVLSRIRGRRRRTAEALQRADGVVTVSQELAHQVIALDVPPSQVRTITSGIDTTRFRPGSKTDARSHLSLPGRGRILLFIGNLVPVKGLDVLVQSCQLLAREGVEFTCHVIGQGPLRSDLERQIARSGLQDQVKLLGPRANEQLPVWFRAADVFVLPSRSEGLPTVLLEALASGCPFVASRVGGIPELAHLGPCRLVRPDDPGQLAGAIRLLLDEAPASATSAPMQPRLRTYAEEAEELSGFLESVIRSHRGAPAVQGPATSANSTREKDDELIGRGSQAIRSR